MLIGGRNAVNEKLVKEISGIVPISYVDFFELQEGELPPESAIPPFVMLNLMDIGLVEETIFRTLKERYPNAKIIALHCYQAESLIQQTLDRGYDHYISILDFSDEFEALLNDQPEMLQG